MTCTIIAAIVSCLGLASTPNPDKAFRTFTSSVPLTQTVVRYPLPPSSSVPPSLPAPSTPRVRLDGTPLTEPPAIYGLPPYFPYQPFNFSYNNLRPHERRDHRTAQR